MSRRKKIRMTTVEPYPDLIVDYVYPGIVKEYTLHEASNRLRVTVENGDSHQEGRRHQIGLRLPIHPLDRTCRFFLACGIEASEIGTQIQIDLILGRRIGLRYRGQGADGTEEFDFERITPPPNAETTDPATESTETKTSEREDTAFPPAVRKTPL